MKRVILLREVANAHTSRVRSLHVSEANMLYEDTHQAKKDVLLASFARLYVLYVQFFGSGANCNRFALPKPLQLKPRNVRMDPEGPLVMTST